MKHATALVNIWRTWEVKDHFEDGMDICDSAMETLTNSGSINENMLNVKVTDVKVVYADASAKVKAVDPNKLSISEYFRVFSGETAMYAVIEYDKEDEQE